MLSNNADASSTEVRTQAAGAYRVGAISDPGRISQMLNLLTRVWTAHPEWRLGQLIVNMQHEAAVLTESSSRVVPLFDIEDARLYAGLAHLAETSIKVRAE